MSAFIARIHEHLILASGNEMGIGPDERLELSNLYFGEEEQLC